MFVARKKQKTLRQKYDMCIAEHPRLACFLIGTGAFAVLVGLYLFVVFSGFGSSADFIYNQF